jgi:hypothetical protein
MLKGVVKSGDFKGWVPDDNGRIGMIEQIFQIVTSFTQRILSLLALGDVEHCALKEEWNAGAIYHHNSIIAEPHYLPITGYIALDRSIADLALLQL